MLSFEIPKVSGLGLIENFENFRIDLSELDCSFGSAANSYCFS